jgi:hypothetical protein
MTASENGKPMTVSTLPNGRAIAAPRVTNDADGTTRLLRLATLAEQLGASRLSEEARELAARISEGRFYVACLGQFKRGKSTLINALIGEPLLPVGYVPVTAVPTVVRFGDPPRARTQGREGSWREIAVSDLQQYVSEEHNPENTKCVAGVEVFVPSPLLAAGMCVEIRKLLHEISLIAELALARARAAHAAGASAVEAELARLNHLEKEVHGAG